MSKKDFNRLKNISSKPVDNYLHLRFFYVNLSLVFSHINIRK